MRIFTEEKNTIIEGIKDFELSQTLECGQCFRFYKQAKQEYVIVAMKKMLHIKQEEDILIFYNTSKEDVEKIWVEYFDLTRDYGEIKKYLLSIDNVLRPAIEEKHGVRILNQEFHETLISFIISQNKQIPHIKKIVRDISEKYGEYLGTVNGEDYYSFPDENILKEIGEEDYRLLKTGFRAPYLRDASIKLQNINVSQLRSLSEEQCRKELLQIKGVGEKVANCVMLFSLGYRNAFPIDVWIKRIMETLYFNKEDTSKEIMQKFAKKQYGEYGGYAQQYLFCFGREMKLGTKSKNEIK